MEGVIRKTLYFTAPRQVELREETLPALGADDVLVEATGSAISAGTEMLLDGLGLLFASRVIEK